MRRRVATLVLFLVVVLTAILALRMYSTRRLTGPNASESSDDRAQEHDSQRSDGTTRDATRSGDAPMALARDRAERERIRAELLRAAAQRAMDAPHSAEPPSAGARAGESPARPAMPERPGGGIDPGYIRDRIREDFVPLAQSCYDSFLVRNPGVGGRARVRFTIIAAAGIGGIVDEAEVIRDDARTDASADTIIDAGDDDVGDEEFSTCLRESLRTVTFRPPPDGHGTVTVTYPFRLRPEHAPPGADR